MKSTISDLKNKIPSIKMKSKEYLGTFSEYAWHSAYKNIHYRQEIPSPYYMNNAADPNAIWVWDSCFMSMYCNYISEIFPGIQALDNFYKWQDNDGYISMCYTFDGKERYGQRINPPLFAWAEWKYYQTTGDETRIKRILPKLVKFFDWINKNRKCSHLPLHWFEDAGSSGMDNSPRGCRLPEAGQYMGWIDLTAQMAVSALYISRLADVIGRKSISNRFTNQWQRISKALIEYCWCPKTKFYHDRLDSSNWLNSKTAAGFWPMLTENIPEKHLEALCRHLSDKNSFARPCPVPTLAYDDCNYENDGAYWLGGVWAPTNYMIMSGLWLNKRYELARKLTVKYLQNMYKTYKKTNTIWEAYSPEKPEPSTKGRNKHLVRPDFTGWSALGPIAMLYEFVLGLELDMPEKTLTWRLLTNEEMEIDNFPVGKGIINLKVHFEDRKKGEICEVTAHSNISLKLILIRNSKTQKIVLKKNKIVKTTL